MPRQRKSENKGLPKGWRIIYGAIYYSVPHGQEAIWDGFKTFRLGKTLHEAYQTWAERFPSPDKANNIGELLDRYALEVIPTKAVSTQKDNQNYVVKLKGAFGSMPLNGLLPKHIYGYFDRSRAKVLARRELACLSHAFTKSVEWGYLEKHPFKGEVRIKSEQPRTRYVEDWEIIECLSLPIKMKRGSVKAVQAYIRIKLLTGMAQRDLLLLTMTQLKEDGIHMQRHKTNGSTGKRTIYEWTPELQAAIEEAKTCRPVDISPYLFCNKKGKSYVNVEKGKARGWASMWQRFMDRVLKETSVKERFTDHDLRAKAGSDASSLEHARALLSHSDSRITQRVYRRKPERVSPIR